MTDIAEKADQPAMTSEQLLGLALSFDEILGLVNSEPADTVLDAVTQVAATHVPGVDWASISLLTGDRFRTASATDDRARQIDQLQYDTRSGPCLDAARNQTLAHIEDTSTDIQWPSFARRAARDCDVGSVLCYRMCLELDDGTVGSLNLYARRRAPFDERRIGIGALIATAGALAVTAARQREYAATLARGLETNREIGKAIGILMYAHKLTHDQAFDLLRIASQKQNRKLRDIASDVATAGGLDL